MPIYEYRCEKCGVVFEVRQSFSDEPVKVCCEKGCKGKVKKLFSPPAIIFKGSGFYVNDYGKGTGKKPPEKKDRDRENSESESEPAKSETSKVGDKASSKAGG